MSSEELFPRSKRIESELKSRISNKGKITFKEFMEVVLYLPEFGYYTNPDREPWRDYFTSPEIHPAFSQTIAKQLHDMYECLGRPKRFSVVEMGAGKGLMAFEILRYSKTHYPDLHDALGYTIIEPSFLVELRQRELLEKQDLGEISWAGPPEKLPLSRIEGCVVSNELLDSYPIHRVSMHDGKLSEVYVALEGHQLVQRLAKPSTPKLQRYFEDLGFFPSRNTLAEVNLQALNWMKTMASIIRRGFVLTIDYGFNARQLFTRHRGGTFLCYHNHAITLNPYIRLGYQDMTSHIDFTSLSRIGEERQLVTLGFTTQRSFLRNLGIEASIPVFSPEYRQVLAAIRKLTDPKGLGRYKVLIQGKNVSKTRLKGLRRL